MSGYATPEALYRAVAQNEQRVSDSETYLNRLIAQLQGTSPRQLPPVPDDDRDDPLAMYSVRADRGTKRLEDSTERLLHGMRQLFQMLADHPPLRPGAPLARAVSDGPARAASAAVAGGSAAPSPATAVDPYKNLHSSAFDDNGAAARAAYGGVSSSAMAAPKQPSASSGSGSGSATVAMRAAAALGGMAGPAPGGGGSGYNGMNSNDVLPPDSGAAAYGGGGMSSNAFASELSGGGGGRGSSDPYGGGGMSSGAFAAPTGVPAPSPSPRASQSQQQLLLQQQQQQQQLKHSQSYGPGPQHYAPQMVATRGIPAAPGYGAPQQLVAAAAAPSAAAGAAAGPYTAPAAAAAAPAAAAAASSSGAYGAASAVHSATAGPLDLAVETKPFWYPALTRDTAAAALRAAGDYLFRVCSDASERVAGPGGVSVANPNLFVLVFADTAGSAQSVKVWRWTGANAASGLVGLSVDRDPTKSVLYRSVDALVRATVGATARAVVPAKK